MTYETKEKISIILKIIIILPVIIFIPILLIDLYQAHFFLGAFVTYMFLLIAVAFIDTIYL